MQQRRSRDPVDEHLQAEAARKLAGQVDGKHYSAHVAEVKALRQAGDDDAAAGLLMRLCDAVEREAQIPLAGRVAVAPWYFDQLAIIFRKAGLNAERERILQRRDRLQAMAEASGLAAIDRLRGATTGTAQADERAEAPARGREHAASKLTMLTGALGRMLGRSRAGRR